MQYVFFKEKKVGIGIVWDPPHPALVYDKVPTFSKIQNGGPSYKPDPKEKGWKITNLMYNSWKSISSPFIERLEIVDW